MRTRSRRHSRRRWADGLCAALWIAALAALAAGGVTSAAGVWARHERIPALRPVVLQPGSTLWGLAVRCCAPGQDPRAVAREIRRLNRLQRGQVVHPGMRILVPDYATGAPRLAQNTQEEG